MKSNNITYRLAILELLTNTNIVIHLQYKKKRFGLIFNNNNKKTIQRKNIKLKSILTLLTFLLF